MERLCPAIKKQSGHACPERRNRFESLESSTKSCTISLLSCILTHLWNWRCLPFPLSLIQLLSLAQEHTSTKMQNSFELKVARTGGLHKNLTSDPCFSLLLTLGIIVSPDVLPFCSTRNSSSDSAILFCFLLLHMCPLKPSQLLPTVTLSFKENTSPFSKILVDIFSKKSLNYI